MKYQWFFTSQIDISISVIMEKLEINLTWMIFSIKMYTMVWLNIIYVISIPIEI